MARPDGNAAKRVEVYEPGEWARWRLKSRAKRARRFIETFCIPAKGFGAGEPLKLAPFQVEWLEQVLAEDVTAAALSVPRGNGKSTLLAALALWALFDEMDNGQPQVPVVATTVGQAIKTVWGPATLMVKKHPELMRRAAIYTAIGASAIKVPYNDGELFPIASDPDGLQGLDPSLAICDEIGFMPIESWDSLLLASGKRPRSLVVGIGTPGFAHDTALWHLRRQALSGELLPGFKFDEYAADEGCDVLDRDQWEKANPALTAKPRYMNPSALETAVALSPEAHFRIFRLGQWVDGVECWLGEDGRKVWRALEDPYEMVPSAPTFAGVDVALKHDTTAVTWVQQRDDSRWHVKSRIWHPREDGRLDVTDVMQFIRDLAAMYDLKGIAFDPRFFDLPAQQLIDEGYPLVEVPQVLERMTPAVGHAFEAIKRAELSHDGDADLEAQVLNAVARYNERGFTLAKSKSKDKIDATVAMVLALSLANTPQEVEPAPAIFVF